MCEDVNHTAVDLQCSRQHTWYPRRVLQQLRYCPDSAAVPATQSNGHCRADAGRMESPLLETTVSGATDIIINFAGNIGMIEAYDAVNYLTEAAGDDVNIIFGTVDNETLGDEVSITIIATGIEAAAKKNVYGSFGQTMGMNSFAKPATPVQPAQASVQPAAPVQPAVSVQPTTPVQPAQIPVQPAQTPVQPATQTSAYRQPVQAGQSAPSYGGQTMASQQPKPAAKPSFLNGTQGSAGNTTQAAPVTTARPQPPKQEADGSIKIPEFLKRR